MNNIKISIGFVCIIILFIVLLVFADIHDSQFCEENPDHPRCFENEEYDCMKFCFPNDYFYAYSPFNTDVCECENNEVK